VSTGTAVQPMAFDADRIRIVPSDRLLAAERHDH